MSKQPANRRGAWARFSAMLSICSACYGCDCVPTEIDRQTSPDGEYDAVVVRRECGAMTAERTAVALIDAGSSAPGDTSDDVFRTKGTFDVSIAWAGDTLVVTHGVGLPVEEMREQGLARPVRFETRSP